MTQESNGFPIKKRDNNINTVTLNDLNPNRAEMLHLAVGKPEKYRVTSRDRNRSFSLPAFFAPHAVYHKTSASVQGKYTFLNIKGAMNALTESSQPERGKNTLLMLQPHVVNRHHLGKFFIVACRYFLSRRKTCNTPLIKIHGCPPMQSEQKGTRPHLCSALQK